MNKKQKDGLKFFLNDKRKKSFPKIVSEFFYLWRLKKEIPWYYFKFLYRKDVTNIKDYLGTKEAYKVKHCPKYHRKECVAVMDNKLSFSLFCQKNQLPAPELVSHNFRSNFFFDGKLSKIKSREELYNFLIDVLDKSHKGKLFVKPISSYGGTGARIVSKDNLQDVLDEVYGNVLQGDFIHENVLVQHQEIDKIHAGCINTLRFETYIDKKGKVHILNAFMRFGRSGNVVDNANLGGVFVGVNMDDGTLKEFAMSHIRFGNEDYYEHPDSKYVFNGFKIPYFEEACDLVVRATEYLPDRYIGWDIAITETGPAIIEANQDPGIFTCDITYGGYLRHPIYKEILEEVKDWAPNN